MEKHRVMRLSVVSLLWGFFLLSCLFAQTSQLSQSDFEAQFLSAYSKSDDNSMRTLIQNHRLMVKPFVNKLISEGIQLELQGENQRASQKLEVAKKAANSFQEIFGEASLVHAVSYLSSWSKEQKSKKLLADSLYNSGTRLRGKREQRDQALQDYRQALALYREIGDLRGEGTTLGGIGFIYWFKRDPEQALAHFQQALDVRKKADDRQLVGNSFSDIGSVYWYFLGDFPKALEHHLQAEKVRREIGDGVGLGKTLANIAITYWDMGKLDEAVTYYDKAALVNERVGDENRMASAVYNAGIILTDLGEYPRALDYLQRALTIRERLADNKRIGDVLNRMGIVFWRLGEFESAIETYQKVMKIMGEVDEQAGMAYALSNIGLVLADLGRTDKALDYFQKALVILQELKDQVGILDALSNLGLAYFDSQEYSKSEEYYLQALERSRALQNKVAETNNLTMLGNAQNFQGKLQPALNNYQEALKKAQALNSPELIWPALLGMGDNYERRREYTKAMDYYMRALDSVEGIRGTLHTEQYKASFLANKRFVYEAVVHLLGQLHEQDQTGGYDRQAFRLAERAKARAFLDLLAEALANVREGVDPNLLQKQEDILSEMTQAQQQLLLESSQEQVDENAVAELKEKINELENEYRSLRHEISLKNPKYSELQYPEPSALKEVQSNVLDDNTVLLEYSLGDSSSSLWVITEDSHQLYRLPNRAALQEQVEIVRFGLLNSAQSSPEFFAESSYKLYQILVQPAESFIKEDAKLVIVPDGVLNYLPFEILLTEKIDGDAKPSYSQLPYLIKSNPISYGQSASVLRSLRAQQRQQDTTDRKRLLAFGDAIFGKNEELALKTPMAAGAFADTTRGGLSRLPYSGLEIQNIANLFPTDQADVYIRREASEEKVKEQAKLTDYQYVHFATHGLINERKPDFSSIVLTQDDDPKEDGFLQAAEIFNLDINADLVVLSACQTGLGKMVRGEGMIGLTRAFMYAGSRSVLVSLWSVSDVSTAKLMEKFYQNLIQKKLEKTEALRQAQLHMIAEGGTSHPFYWAPFVLIGDWQ